MKESNLALRTVVERMSTVELMDDRAVTNGSIAVFRRSSPTRNEPILAHFSANHDKAFAATEQIHGELRLARESKSVAEIRARLAQAAESGSFEVIDGLKIEINQTASLNLLPSDDPQTGIGPRYELELSACNRVHLNSSGPLVAYGQPSFESVEQAVRAWIRVRPFHGSSDARLGSVLIEVPLSAPRLGALSLENERSLKIAILGLPRKTPIELTGVWQSSDAASIEPFAQMVAGDSVEVSRPPWADQVTIWLVRPDSLITDYFFENPGRCSRARRILYPPAAETNRGESGMLTQILSGEGENLEFKPFLRPGSDKFAELIRTVMAFANKRGGTLYLGVSDHQEIEGVEKELWEATPTEEKNTLDTCSSWYCALVRKRICDRVSKRIDFRVEPMRISATLLIVVEVAEAKDKPCADAHTNDIWTRRGANTVRPSPEELKQLFTFRPGVAGLFDET